MSHFTSPSTSGISGAVQVMDSHEPLVPTPSGSTSTSPVNVSEPLASTSRPSGSTGYGRHSHREEIKKMWNFDRLREKAGTEDQCVEFAEERGLLPREKLCSYHKQPMRKESGHGLGLFRCRKSQCRRKTQRVAAGTWFENSKICLVTIF